MTPMIVVSTYLLIGLVTARLCVYCMHITKSGMTGEDFILLPLAVLFWWFFVWFVIPFSIQEWWDNREKHKGRPQWLVDTYVTLFGLKEK